MAYVPGQKVIPADYLSLIGGQASDVPFTSEAAAANKISGIFGVGYGQYGYNQTGTYPLRPVNASEVVSATPWRNLQGAFEATLLHQGQSIANLPSSGFFDPGDKVFVHDGRPGLGDWLSHIPTIDNASNRLADPRTNPGSYTLVGPVITDTKTVPWGTSTGVPGSNTLSFGVEFTFASGDHARAFFNAGGEIVYRYTYGNTSNGHATAWTYFLETKLGDVRLGRDYFVIDGDGSYVPTILSSPGYWNMTSSSVMIVKDTDLGDNPITGSTYRPITFRAHQQRISAANTSGNGDNGDKIYFITVPIDQYSGPDDEMPPGVKAEVFFRVPSYLPDSLQPVSYTITNPLDPAP